MNAITEDYVKELLNEKLYLEELDFSKKHSKVYAIRMLIIEIERLTRDFFCETEQNAYMSAYKKRNDVKAAIDALLEII